MRDKNPPKTVIGFDAHYGMIGVESKLGKGSTFSVMLSKK
jgi:light-regulated signal transduction histidine kinase (bacteriophytochrome)